MSLFQFLRSSREVAAAPAPEVPDERIIVEIEDSDRLEAAQRTSGCPSSEGLDAVLLADEQWVRRRLAKQLITHIKVMASASSYIFYGPEAAEQAHRTEEALTALLVDGVLPPHKGPTPEDGKAAK